MTNRPKDERRSGAEIPGMSFDQEAIGDRVAETASELIDLLKTRLGATTDQNLAQALKVGRSTVANWRRRGRVPARYAILVDPGAKARLDAAFN